MGVWIETSGYVGYNDGGVVTPCMGVWIETKDLTKQRILDRSHPVWVCGLKHLALVAGATVASHTLYGCVD